MRKFAFILVIAISLPILSAPRAYHSRGHAFEVSAGAGYASLGYEVNTIAGQLASKTAGTYSAQAHIGYNWFFSEYAGFAIGVDAQHYGQSATLDGLLHWNGVTDSDGELYEHILELRKWSERHDYWTIEVPVSFVFSIPVHNVVYITTQIGGKYGLPLSANYTGNGSLTHTGYYKPWNLTLSDKPNHGFYTEENFKPKGTLPSKSYWTVFAKAGVAVPLIEHLDLLVQAYFNYALTNIAEKGQDEPIGFRNDRAGQEQNHYFMSNYTDLHNTAVITDPFKPWAVGLEIGIRYTIAHRSKSKYPCRCLKNQ